MQYLLLFLEGIITFISPCLLPMLPVYVSFFAAGESGARGRAVKNSLGFVLGFTLVFVALGAFAGALGGLLTNYANIVNIVSGAVMIVLGLNFAGAVKLGLLNRSAQKSADVRDLRFLSAMMFGIVFSIGWTPCVGTFLSSALILASRQGGAAAGVLMLLTYSLGLGLPFVASAVLIDRLKGAFAAIKRNYKVINIVSGALLIIVGLLMMSGQMWRLQAFFTP